MADVTLEAARRYVKDITGLEATPLNDSGVSRQLFEALVQAHFDRLVVTEERDLLGGQLDAITKQRAKWRRSKQKGRKIAANPQRYSPAQESIYGDGHVAELTKEKTPQ